MNKLILFGAFFLLFFVFVKGDACTFTLNATYSPSQVRTCFNLFPLSSSVKEITLNQVKAAFKIHPLTDLLPTIGLSIPRELRRIESTNYTNDYNFHNDVFQLFLKVPDSETLYTPPRGYLAFQIVRPFILAPFGTTDNIVIAAKDPKYNESISNSVLFKTVVSVNGVPTAKYFADYYNPSQDDSTQFMFNYLSQGRSLPLHFILFPERDNETFIFSDGTNITLPVKILASSNIPNVTRLNFANTPTSTLTPSSTKKNEGERFDRIEDITKNLFVNLESKEDLTKKSDLTKKAVTFTITEQTNDKTFARGFVVNGTQSLPFLRIRSLPFGEPATVKRIAFNFVKDLAERKSPVAIIDLTIYSGGSTLCLAEWLINLLNQIPARTYEQDTYESQTHRTFYNARLTSKYAKEVLSSLSSNFIDPTSGIKFSDPFCPINNPITEKRYKSKQLFSPKFFLPQCKNFVEAPRFDTKFIILTSPVCAAICNHFQRVLRYRNVGKIVAIGGLTGKPYPLSSYFYSDDCLSWNSNVVPLLSLSPSIQSLPTTARLSIAPTTSFVSSSDIPESFVSFFPDEVIGWNRYTFTEADLTDPSPLYLLASKLDTSFKPSNPLPSFDLHGKCFANPEPEYVPEYSPQYSSQYVPEYSPYKKSI